MVLTFRQRVGFMQSRVSARFAGRSPVECSHFVFTATSRRRTLYCVGQIVLVRRIHLILDVVA